MDLLDIKQRALLLMGALYDVEELSALNAIFILDECSDFDNAVINISTSQDIGPNEYMLMLNFLQEYFIVDKTISFIGIDSEYNNLIVQR